jgi:LytS/YehU family sensor histidine kinase
LRFSIQEAQLDFTRIENELSFLEQYINLQKARLPQLSSIDIKTHIEWDHHMAQIPPLLLIPFVENAFQYSISMEKPCFLHLDLAVKNQFLEMQLVNSIAPHADRKKGMGTGINNAKARLQLLYPGRHQLDIQAQESQYFVHLTIQLTYP